MFIRMWSSRRRWAAVLSVELGRLRSIHAAFDLEGGIPQNRSRSKRGEFQVRRLVQPFRVRTPFPN